MHEENKTYFSMVKLKTTNRPILIFKQMHVVITKELKSVGFNQVSQNNALSHLIGKIVRTFFQLISNSLRICIFSLVFMH